jgi:DNA-binding GntR family transcriptional regulator
MSPRTPAARRVAPLARIVQDSTPSLIAAQLREAIAIGHFAPGEQLAETSLANSLGVSRGPLREAMQRLTQEGLLVSYRNRGLFVIELTPDDVRDIYLARDALERAAAAALITARRHGEAAALIPLAEAMRDPDPEASNQADFDFHETLVRLSRSPRLIAMHSTMLTQMRMCLALMQPSYDTPDQRADEHAAIAQALVERKGRSVDRLLREHMVDGLKRLDVEPGVS